MAELAAAIGSKINPFDPTLRRPSQIFRRMIVPTLRVGMHPVTLRVTTSRADAERPGRHSHAERGNDHNGGLEGMAELAAAIGSKINPFDPTLRRPSQIFRRMIVPTLRVGMHPVTLRVTTSRADAERPGRHSHAERGNDHNGGLEGMA